MRRILLLMLSLTVLFCMSSACFAATATETTVVTGEAENGASVSAQTVVITSPSYTVSVPTGIAVGEIVKSESSSIKSTPFTVGVSGLSDLDGKQVKVTLSTPHNGFYLYSGDHVLPYEVFNTPTASNTDTPIAMNGIFYTFLQEGSVTGHIEIDQYRIPAEGTYGGILTFTFQVEDQPES